MRLSAQFECWLDDVIAYTEVFGRTGAVVPTRSAEILKRAVEMAGLSCDQIQNPPKGSLHSVADPTLLWFPPDESGPTLLLIKAKDYAG